MLLLAIFSNYFIYVREKIIYVYISIDIFNVFLLSLPYPHTIESAFHTHSEYCCSLLLLLLSLTHLHRWIPSHSFSRRPLSLTHTGAQSGRSMGKIVLESPLAFEAETKETQPGETQQAVPFPLPVFFKFRTVEVSRTRDA